MDCNGHVSGILISDGLIPVHFQRLTINTLFMEHKQCYIVLNTDVEMYVFYKPPEKNDLQIILKIMDYFLFPF